MNLKTDNKSLWYLRKYPFEYCFDLYRLRFLFTVFFSFVRL